MYLSQLVLNPRSRDARRDAGDEYQMHSTLARLFADAPKDEKERRFEELTRAEKERVLFRIERHANDGLVRALVQSYRAPDFSKLPTGYCATSPQTRGDYEEKLKALTPGQAVRFRLRANPTVKKQGKRLGLREPAQQQAWLERKLHEAGAELLDCRFMPHEVTPLHKHKTFENTPSQIHLGVLFEGVLRVTDPAALRAAVENGIGSAKGYGFGLLSLAPA
ncbi:MAG: type I-E CRISPR-associated protein Cas6/Cse3/CasE [Anaerolineales bacterium]